MVAVHAFYLWSLRDRIGRGDPDFTAFYTAATLLRSGHGSQIYDPSAQFRIQKEFAADSDLRQGPLRYIHPPFEVLLFLPLAFLSYRNAFILWDLVNLAGIVALAAICPWGLLTHLQIRTWEAVLALLALFPIFVNFFQGQDAILLLLIVVLAFRAQYPDLSGVGHPEGDAPEWRGDFIAGCWLGLGIFRYQIIIPLVLILALWRRRRTVLGFVVVGAVELVVSFILVGWEAMVQYPGYVWQWSSTPGLGRTPPALLPNILGLITGWSGLEDVRPLLQVGVLVVSLALFLVPLGMIAADRNPRLSGLSFACAVLTSVLIAYNTSTYDLSLLVLPLVLVTHYCLRGAADPRRALRSLMLPAVPLLISPLWFLLGMHWQKFNLMAVFLLWWLFVLWKELRRVQAGLESFRAPWPAT